MLLLPFLAGACIGIPHSESVINVLILLVGTLSLFWLRTPLESYLGWSLIKARTREEKRATLKAMLLLAPVALLSLTYLIWFRNRQSLLLIGAVVGTAFALQAVLKLWGRKSRLIAQIVGAIGLTSTAAAAYYSLTGRLDLNALAVWFAFWLFAGDQIHYVQLRLRTAKTASRLDRAKKGKLFLAGQGLMLAVVIVSSHFHLLPLLAAAAFAPVVFRGFFWLAENEQEVDIPWLGVTELLQGITFGVLLTSIFYLQR